MPNFPWPDHRDVPGTGDTSLAALLAGAGLRAVPLPELQPITDILAALTAGPAGDELAGEHAALAEFRSRFGGPVPAGRSRHRRRASLTSLLSGKAAAVVMAGIGLGGAVAGAWAGLLPVPAGTHARPGAASTPVRPKPASTSAAPDATGPAAFRLCTAYAHAKAHGASKQSAAASRSLETAAGGAANVTSYCAAKLHPGASSAPAPQPTPRATGQRTSHPRSLWCHSRARRLLRVTGHGGPVLALPRGSGPPHVTRRGPRPGMGAAWRSRSRRSGPAHRQEVASTLLRAGRGQPGAAGGRGLPSRGAVGCMPPRAGAGCRGQCVSPAEQEAGEKRPR